MANLVIDARDRFPVGTVVGAYPGNSLTAGAGFDRVPAATAIETQTVAAGGTLTYTTLVDGTAYVLSAAVGGQARAIRVIHNQGYTAPTKWAAKVAARRAAIGTS